MRIALLWMTLALALLAPTGAGAQWVSVGLFDRFDLQTLQVETVGKGYSLEAEGLHLPLDNGARLSVARAGDSLEVTVPGVGAVRIDRFLVTNRNARSKARLRVYAGADSVKGREYPGNLHIAVDFRRLMCISLVEINPYVAGVVRQEMGGGAPLEAYKVQALLVRTYLLSHLTRHVEEGFNLCDGVHCQAYGGAVLDAPDVLRAVEQTEGQVVVDGEGRFISAVFHASCGGQTADAGSVWLSGRTSPIYLRSMPDDACLSRPSATWTRKVARSKWTTFLTSKGVDASLLTDAALGYQSHSRRYEYPMPGGVKVPFRDLREYFGLPSGWFDVQVSGENIILRGRGMGHGIGMCQQGAMGKAKQGWKVQRILEAYYPGVRISPQEEAKPLNPLDDPPQ